MFGKKMINFSVLYDVIKENTDLVCSTISKEDIISELEDKYDDSTSSSTDELIFEELDKLHKRGVLDRDEDGDYRLPKGTSIASLEKRIIEVVKDLSWSNIKTIAEKVGSVTESCDVEEVLDELVRENKLVRRFNQEKDKNSERWEYRVK